MPFEPKDLAALPIFPLPGAALFPDALLPLHVFEPRYRELVRAVLASNRLLGVACLKPGFEPEYQGRPAVFDVFGFGEVVEHEALPDGRFNITLRGLGRARIIEEFPAEHRFRVVHAELLSDLPVDSAVAGAWQRKLASLWAGLASELPEAVRDLRAITQGAETAGAFADRLAAILASEPSETQALLAERDPSERLRLLTQKIQQAVDVLSGQRDSSSRLN